MERPNFRKYGRMGRALPSPMRSTRGHGRFALGENLRLILFAYFQVVLVYFVGKPFVDSLDGRRA